MKVNDEDIARSLGAIQREDINMQDAITIRTSSAEAAHREVTKIMTGGMPDSPESKMLRFLRREVGDQPRDLTLPRDVLIHKALCESLRWIGEINYDEMLDFFNLTLDAYSVFDRWHHIPRMEITVSVGDTSYTMDVHAPKMSESCISVPARPASTFWTISSSSPFIYTGKLPDFNFEAGE